jgi:hypothetical protein
VITGLRRVSKPGLRIYTNVEDMPKVMKGLGVAILSTPTGLMTDNSGAQSERRWRSSRVYLVKGGKRRMSRIGRKPIDVPSG